MDITKLSCEELESFVGDVRPVWVETTRNIPRNKTKWSCEGDAVTLRAFCGAEHGSFDYGVLLTFVKEGAAKVTVNCDGEELS